MNTVFESDAKGSLEDIPIGSRIFVVRVYDPSIGAVIVGATVIEPDRLEKIDDICAKENMPFRLGMQLAAAEQILTRMLSDSSKQEDLEVRSVDEVSQRELRQLVAEKSATFEAGKAS